MEKQYKRLIKSLLQINDELHAQLDAELEFPEKWSLWLESLRNKLNKLAKKYGYVAAEFHPLAGPPAKYQQVFGDPIDQETIEHINQTLPLCQYQSMLSCNWCVLYSTYFVLCHNWKVHWVLQLRITTADYQLTSHFVGADNAIMTTVIA